MAATPEGSQKETDSIFGSLLNVVRMFVLNVFIQRCTWNLFDRNKKILLLERYYKVTNLLIRII